MHTIDYIHSGEKYFKNKSSCLCFQENVLFGKSIYNILALIHPKSFFHRKRITVDIDSQAVVPAVHSAGEVSSHQKHIWQISLENECNCDCCCTSDWRLLHIVAAEPKHHFSFLQISLLAATDVSLPCWVHMYALTCFLLVRAPTSYVFANTCHTTIYCSVFRFVYAHFIVAIIDSCCMDLEKTTKKF